MKFLVNTAIAILSVLVPTKPVLITAFLCVVVDFITGILAARKKGEALTSRGFRRSVTKLCVYEVALTLAFLAGQYLIVEMPIFKIAASMIGITEIRSILENLSVVTDAPALRFLIERLGGPKESK